MIVKQIKLKMMEVFCYLIGDEISMTCALVDPAFETERVLDIADKEGFKISFVINTHSHADHCSGNADIVDATGARLLIHEKDAPGLNKMRNRLFARVLGGKGSPGADVLLREGNVINIGETPLKVLHTPGHSPGSICLYSNGNIFTGDTLFVGAVGRTDLTGGSHRQLLNSVREKIYTLPDNTTIWPGHDYGHHPSSTIKVERETNPFTL